MKNWRRALFGPSPDERAAERADAIRAEGLLDLLRDSRAEWHRLEQLVAGLERDYLAAREHRDQLGAAYSDVYAMRGDPGWPTAQAAVDQAHQTWMEARFERDRYRSILDSVILTLRATGLVVRDDGHIIIPETS